MVRKKEEGKEGRRKKGKREEDREGGSGKHVSPDAAYKL